MPRPIAQIDFPDRVWEPDGSGKWFSRATTLDDLKRRGQILHELKAVSNSPYVPFNKE